MAASSSASTATRRRRGWMHGSSFPWRCWAFLAFVRLLAAAADASAFLSSSDAKTARPRPHRHTTNGISTKTRKRKEGRCSLSPPFGFLTGRPSSANAVQVCHLFFRQGDVLTATKTPKTDRSTLRRICEDLSSSSTRLPFETSLSNGKDAEKLTIRAVKPQDLTAITEMCVAEYDSGPSSFPLDNLDLLPEWFDRQALYALVYWTTLVKVVDNSNSSSGSVPNDHAVLVACIDKNDIADDAVVVGMVEVSRQPVRATRNPPPYPLPVPLKQLLNIPSKQQQQQQQLQGWLCNLLVIPEFRGRGLSKMLVAAGEGVVRHCWGCDSMYLHCDADCEGDGRVPQRLYESMQYERQKIGAGTPQRTTTNTSNSNKNDEDDPNTSWIPTNNSKKKNYDNEDGVVVVEGVPLLYLRKDLTTLQ